MINIVEETIKYRGDSTSLDRKKRAVKLRLQTCQNELSSSTKTRTAFKIFCCSFKGSLLICSDSSVVLICSELSSTSRRSESAVTFNALAIYIKVSSFGALTPRSITLICVELSPTISASCSCVRRFDSLASLIRIPIAFKSMATPPFRTTSRPKLYPA